MKRIAMITTCALGLAIGGAAFADDTHASKPAPTDPAPASAATAEIKAGTGIEKFEVVGEGTKFPAGTTVWVWSRITNGDGNVKHVWRQDGKDVWTAVLPVGSKRWATGSRRTIAKPGNWEVEVLAESGASLGKVAFTIQ